MDIEANSMSQGGHNIQSVETGRTSSDDRCHLEIKSFFYTLGFMLGASFGIGIGLFFSTSILNQRTDDDKQDYTYTWKVAGSCIGIGGALGSASGLAIVNCIHKTSVRFNR